MTHVFQIVFTVNRYDWRFEDYIVETIEGPIYATEEAANEHKAWYDSEPGGGTCEVQKVAVRDHFKPRR